MARYPDKPQALVDYAGILGLAHLRDPSGRTIASSRVALPYPRAHVGMLAPMPGAVCKEPGKHELKIEGYTLTIYVSPGISPAAVAARIEGCKRLMRALGRADAPWGPPDGGEGGRGPPAAELRVWPPPLGRKPS
jgi:hypothetical protein